MKYLERLNETAEAKAKNNNQLLAKEKHLDVQKEMIECEKQIAAQEQAIEAMKNSTGFTAKAVYQADNKLALLKREFEYYQNLVKELF